MKATIQKVASQLDVGGVRVRIGLVEYKDRGDEFVTPAPSGAILHGTTQLSMFEHLERTGRTVAYRDIPASELETVDAAWLVSSVRLAVPITAIDGRAIPVDTALTRELNEYLLSPRD